MNFPEPALHLTGPVLYAEKALCVIWEKVHSVSQQPPEAAKNCVVKERQSSAPSCPMRIKVSEAAVPAKLSLAF